MLADLPSSVLQYWEVPKISIPAAQTNQHDFTKPGIKQHFEAFSVRLIDVLCPRIVRQDIWLKNRLGNMKHHMPWGQDCAQTGTSCFVNRS